MRPVKCDVDAVRAYRAERLGVHGVDLDPDRCFMRDNGVMEQYSCRQRSLSLMSEGESCRVCWQRREVMDRDQDFSDRGDIREAQLRREVMDKGQGFSDRGDIREPQLRRVVMDRDQDFSDRGGIREPQLRKEVMGRGRDFSDRGDIREPQLRRDVMDRDQDFGDRGDRTEAQSRRDVMDRDQDFGDRGDTRETQLRREVMDRDQDFSDRGDIRESQLRREVMDRDQDFSDRGDIRESQLRREVMDRDQDFSDGGDIREPQLRRSGLMVRDEEFSYRGDIVQPRLKSPVYSQVHEKPQHHYQASVKRDEKERRRHGIFDYEDRYEAACRTGEDYDYEYDSARSVQCYNVNNERGVVHRYGSDRHKLLILEDGSSRGAHSLPFDSQSASKYVETARSPLSAHIQPREIRYRDEIACYPDPFLLDKLSAIEMCEREERIRFHPKDVSLDMESASRSKDLASPSQYKECLATISGTSRMNYAPMIQDDMHLLGDIQSRSSPKLRQPLYLNEYGENHNYNTLEDYAAGHKELTSYQYDKVSSPRGDNMDYVYLKGRPRDASDYGHSYERTTFLEQAVLDKRHARAQILSEPLRENISDSEFARSDVISSSSWDHHSLKKQPISMSFSDGRSLMRSSQGQFYVDSNDTDVHTQNVRESDIENLDVPCDEDIPLSRLDCHRENISDNEFPQRDVINSSSWDHHSLSKQKVSMSFFDGRSLVRSSKGQFYVDSNETNVDTQIVRESDRENFDVHCHEEIPLSRLDYHSSKSKHSNIYAEGWRRSPRVEHEMEMLGDRIRPKKIEAGLIGRNGHPIRSGKRKCILDEEKIEHSSGRIVFSEWKKNINRTQDIDYRNEVWDGQDASGLSSPENFENDKCFGKAERTYNGDLYGRVAATDGSLSYRGSTNQGQRHLIRPYNPGKKQKVHEDPSSLRKYISIQCNKKHHRTKNVWIRGKDDKQSEASDHVVKELKDQVAFAKTEFPEDSIEFKQLVHNFSLSYSKKLNESVATQKRYKEQGRAGGLYCIVCAKSQLKEFKDTRSLAIHCFMSQKVWLKAKHLGLHKAICVLIGWNSDAPPDGKLWVPVAVPAPNALAQKEDLILWPPVVVMHNCSRLVTGIDGQKVMIEAVENFLRGKGFSGGRMKVCMGKPGNGSVLLVKFLGTIPGIQDAEKLHNYFMEEEHGRKDFEAVTSTKGKSICNRNLKGDKVEEILLYGYMGIAEDLDKVDIDTKRRSLIKSKKEIHDFVDAPVKSIDED